MKKIYRRWNLSQKQEMEAYLEYMAKNGYMLDKVGPIFVSFRKAKSRDCKFCIDYFDPPRDKGDAEYLDLCSDTGWEYIHNSGYDYYFRAKGDSPRPIHTDPQVEAENERQIKGGKGDFIFNLVCFLIVAFGIADGIFYIGVQRFISNLVSIPGLIFITLPIALLVYLSKRKREDLKKVEGAAPEERLRVRVDYATLGVLPWLLLQIAGICIFSANVQHFF